MRRSWNAGEVLKQQKATENAEKTPHTHTYALTQEEETDADEEEERITETKRRDCANENIGSEPKQSSNNNKPHTERKCVERRKQTRNYKLFTYKYYHIVCTILICVHVLYSYYDHFNLHRYCFSLSVESLPYGQYEFSLCSWQLSSCEVQIDLTWDVWLMST